MKGSWLKIFWLVVVSGGVGTFLWYSVSLLSPSVSEVSPVKNVFWERQKTLYQELLDSGMEVSLSNSSGLGPVLGLIRTAALWLPQGDANPADVLEGKTFYSKGSRSTQTGTIPLKEGDNQATGQSSTSDGISLTVPNGYYDGTATVTATNQQVANLSPQLTANNLLSSATVFGIQGNIPLKTGNNSSTNQATAGGLVYLTAPTGYYDGDDRVSATNAQIASLSPSLTGSNILSGVTIFGVTGSIPLKTGDSASTAQATAGGLVYLTAPTGYYSGTDRISATNAQIVALDPNLVAGNIITGVSIFGVTGTYPNPTNCSTEAYHDSYGAPVTEITNCSLTWGAPTTSVTGDDNRAGRGPRDPRTGLVWSKYLKNNAGVVEFADSGGSTWSWDATGANNIAVGGKTASQLCSERGNGWRLPTQKELMFAYGDGSYWNLTNSANNFWSATESSATNAWLTTLSAGYANGNFKTNLNSVRCVR